MNTWFGGTAKMNVFFFVFFFVTVSSHKSNLRPLSQYYVSLKMLFSYYELIMTLKSGEVVLKVFIIAKLYVQRSMSLSV